MKRGCALCDTTSEILLQSRLSGTKGNLKTFCQCDRRGDCKEKAAIYAPKERLDQRMVGWVLFNVVDNGSSIEKEAGDVRERVCNFHFVS